jgi:hypothetical protein
LVGLQAGRVRLRTHPSHVEPTSYTHAVLSGTSGAIELHTGIYITGRSGAEHEVDVVAIDDRTGTNSTAIGRVVTHHDVHWAMEAKLFATAKPLSLSIPRAVLGTAYDLSLLPSLRRTPMPLMALVTSARLSPNAHRLLTYGTPSKPRVVAINSIVHSRSSRIDAFVDSCLGPL